MHSTSFEWLLTPPFVGRLVEHGEMRRGIEALYAAYLPKTGHPWVYAALKLPPPSLDVNVHPTKREVRFLNEEEVLSFVNDAISAALRGGNASRTFYSQVVVH